MCLQCYPVTALYEHNQIKCRNAGMIKTVFLSGREYCLKANWSSCLKGILKTFPIFNSIYFYIALKTLMHKVAGDVKAVKVVLICYVSEILRLRISIYFVSYHYIVRTKVNCSPF